MDSGYAEEYRRLHEQHWWWRSREETVLSLLGELNQGHGNQRILDIGCGDGLMFDELAEFGEVEGVEIDGSIVSPNNPWRDAIHVAPFDEKFQPEKTYDTILMLDVLEHLPNPVAALRHSLGLLAPGGKLVITVPAFRFLWTTHDDLNHHFTHYTRASFRQLADGVARIQQDRYLFHWLFLAKLLVRVKESFFATKPRPPRWLNGFLYHVMRCEQRWLRGLNLPLGGFVPGCRGTGSLPFAKHHDCAFGRSESSDFGAAFHCPDLFVTCQVAVRVTRFLPVHAPARDFR